METVAPWAVAATAVGAVFLAISIPLAASWIALGGIAVAVRDVWAHWRPSRA